MLRKKSQGPRGGGEQKEGRTRGVGGEGQWEGERQKQTETGWVGWGGGEVSEHQGPGKDNQNILWCHFSRSFYCAVFNFYMLLSSLAHTSV